MQFPVRLVARRTPGCMMWLSPVLALGLTVLFGAILFAMLGKDPLNALYVFLIAPLETLRGWAEVGVKMTPLLLLEYRCRRPVPCGCHQRRLGSLGLP